ncbi:type II toxin-antitoxin system PrlF family antitoxin [Enterobacteriaceae bacterium G50]|nr:type II toxin-antitoxin system PrlF family antitoxin [Enterobacteriaceae bacterium G50]
MLAYARSDAVLTTESKVTVRGQTTLPTPVREALKLKPGEDSIQYDILSGGQVLMSRVGDEQEDHTMKAFLQFLDTDIQNHPQQLRPFDMHQGKTLVSGMDINIDDEIGDDD